MGYRSEVVLVLRDDVLKRFADRHSVKDLVNIFDDTDQLLSKDDTSGNKWYLFYWSAIKWYPDFAEVARVTDFLTELDIENMGDTYSFTRIGEENDDIEYSGNYDTPFAVNINRTISWD